MRLNISHMCLLFFSAVRAYSLGGGGGREYCFLFDLWLFEYSGVWSVITLLFYLLFILRYFVTVFLKEIESLLRTLFVPMYTSLFIDILV